MNDKMKEALRQAGDANATKVTQTELSPDSRQPALNQSLVVDNNTYPNVMDRGKEAMAADRAKNAEDKGLDR